MPEKKTKSLKAESPFTQYFADIRKESQESQENVKTKVCPPENPLYNPQYIDFLMKYFMPYCAIWGGFCFATLTDEEGEALTRITNGIIERFWSYKKKSQSYLAQTPINYTNSSLDKTRGQARIFIKSMKGEEVCSDSIDSSSDSDIEDELNEHNHKEGWSKKRKIIKVKSRKPPPTGHYQKSTQVFKKTKFAVPTMPPVLLRPQLCMFCLQSRHPQLLNMDSLKLE